MSFSTEEFLGDLTSLLQAWHMVFSSIVLRLDIIDTSLCMLGKGTCQMCGEGGEQGYGKQSYSLELVPVRLWFYHCRNRHTPASLPAFQAVCGQHGVFLIEQLLYLLRIFISAAIAVNLFIGCCQSLHSIQPWITSVSENISLA